MKTVLITGAYRGLGFEVAKQLSERGFGVILSARKPELGRAAAAKLRNACFLEMDISDPESVRKAAGQLTQLDVLVNNAAILQDGDADILRVPPELVLQTLATNTVGALRVAQAFVPLLLKSPAGRIVNVSSGGGQLSEMGTWAPAYCISKTALNAVTRIFSAESEGTGVLVNSVCPGWCRTEMGGAAAPRSPEQGAAGIVWLAADAPQEKTGLFWRDREVIPW